MWLCGCSCVAVAVPTERVLWHVWLQQCAMLLVRGLIAIVVGSRESELMAM
jgi:hypothetical protein